MILQKEDTMQNARYWKNRIRTRSADIMGEEHMRKAAVVVPLLQLHDEYHIMFERRAWSLQSQPGEICFPGGKIDDSDPTPLAAGLREFEEETGIPSHAMDVWGALDVVVQPFQRIVYPYIGEVDYAGDFSPNTSEVDELFTVPLDFFLKHEPEKHNVYMGMRFSETFPTSLIPNEETYRTNTTTLPQFIYHYQNVVIWGLTAQIIRHAVSLLR
ncbi:CoA pyrophosphatase [uncultured Marinococcus sp.]|uniref:NUDIX hydrolase n=1 Tax=uncultured Marinococcus sp. TaxID=487012 RepID=UPI002606ABB2|nr:CoA pyrophosphatase [uncultured Marinococcus sp.]